MCSCARAPKIWPGKFKSILARPSLKLYSYFSFVKFIQHLTSLLFVTGLPCQEDLLAKRSHLPSIVHRQHPSEFMNFSESLQPTNSSTYWSHQWNRHRPPLEIAEPVEKWPTSMSTEMSPTRSIATKCPAS